MNEATFHGILNPRSTRSNDWLRVFETDRVPLKSPTAILANVPGKQAVPVFLLSLEHLDAGTMTRLYDHLAQRFGTPRDAVEEIVQREGMPILADDVIVIGDGLLFI